MFEMQIKPSEENISEDISDNNAVPYNYKPVNVQFDPNISDIEKNLPTYVVGTISSQQVNSLISVLSIEITNNHFQSHFTANSTGYPAQPRIRLRKLSGQFKAIIEATMSEKRTTTNNSFADRRYFQNFIPKRKQCSDLSNIRSNIFECHVPWLLRTSKSSIL